jgi:hypothetical protein
MSTDEVAELLKNFHNLPDSAFVPTIVAARHDGVSPRTVRRTYPLWSYHPAVRA